MATLLISHDLAVIARHCRRVIVMYGGEAMEEGPVETVLGDARHPYTQALLGARPRFGAPRGARLSAIAGAAADGRRDGDRLSVRAALPSRGGNLRRAPPPILTLAGGHRVRCARVDAEGRPI